MTVLIFLMLISSIHYQSTLSKFSVVVGTRSGASSPEGRLDTKSCNNLCCFGPNCCIISGNRSLMVLVSGYPLTINVLF
jgi:hypothetical protein